MVGIPPFRATVAEIGERIALVSVSGELDLYVADDFRVALEAAQRLACQTAVVDLSGVSFMDSTICGILVAEASRRRQHDGELVIVSHGDRAGKVLRVSGIDRFVAVHPTLHSALQSILLEVVT